MDLSLESKLGFTQMFLLVPFCLIFSSVCQDYCVYTSAAVIICVLPRQYAAFARHIPAPTDADALDTAAATRRQPPLCDVLCHQRYPTVVISTHTLRATSTTNQQETYCADVWPLTAPETIIER